MSIKLKSKIRELKNVIEDFETVEKMLSECEHSYKYPEEVERELIINLQIHINKIEGLKLTIMEMHVEKMVEFCSNKNVDIS